MTVIACDGKSIAADGLVLSGNVIAQRDAAKLVATTTKPGVIGVAGWAAAVAAVAAWADGGGGAPLPDQLKDSDAWCAMWLRTDGVWSTESQTRIWTPDDVPMACGSGREIAIGAMLAGASAAEAVALVCERDVSCGGRVMVASLDSAPAAWRRPSKLEVA